MDKLTKATLVLADDHPLFMKGLITALGDEFSIIGVAENGQRLLALLREKTPSLILSDLQMPFMDGLTAARQIAIQYPQIKIIILSVFHDKYIECQLKQIGVKGYLTKDIDSDFLIFQMNQVLIGELAYCKPVEEKQFQINLLFNYPIKQYKLSSRELEIISLIRKGFTSDQIAKTLFISINTVEAHRKHIFKKLNIKNIQGMVEFAYKHSL